TNRGPEPAPIDVLPTVWFRNTWSWHTHQPRPSLARAGAPNAIALREPKYGARYVHFAAVRLEPDTTDVAAVGLKPDTTDGAAVRAQIQANRTIEPDLLFTENDTNAERLYGVPNASPYVKDAFHRYVVDGDATAVNPAGMGTKACARYALTIASGE